MLLLELILAATLAASVPGARPVPPSLSRGALTPCTPQDPEPAEPSEPSEPSEASEAPEAPQPPTWDGSVTVGASLSTGNTDIQKASTTVDAVKELERSRYTLGFSWNFSKEDDLVTQRKVFGKGQFDRKVSERLYWLLQASAEADEKADVDLRTTTGVGAGYRFIDGEKLELSGEAGIAYFTEEFSSGVQNEYFSARLAYKLDWVYSARWAVVQSAAIFPSLEDREDVYAKVDTRLKATLTGSMFAQLHWVFDWDNTPAAGSERGDNLYLLTVGWKF